MSLWAELLSGAGYLGVHLQTIQWAVDRWWEHLERQPGRKERAVSAGEKYQKKKKKQPLKFILLVKVTLRALTNPKFQNKVYFLFAVRRQLFPAWVPLTWLCCALGHEVPASICPQENRGSRGPNTHPLLKSLCLEVKSLLITLLRWDLVTWPHLYMQGNPRNVALVWAAACQQRQDIMEC